MEEHFPSVTETIGSENIIDDAKVTIQKILPLLSLRHPHVLIQLWAPYNFGKHMLLKTIDQPFRLDIANDILGNYRRESECIMFAVDDTCKDKDLNPVVRAFKRGLPEWTCDITNDFSKDYEKHKDSFFVRWNLHGYLILPVFDSFNMICVGVLEFVTISKYLDCAYEVEQVHRILKETNLKSPQAFVGPTSYVHERDKITRILQNLCDTHKLPLAQTWMVSSLTSFVVTGRNINKTCSSYSSSCVGITCLSTNDLPFYVRDDRCAHFREACGVHHLQKSQGFVGRAFSSHGSCFCGDVKKLDEKEYSLVHKARTTELTSCFAIYLHSHEHDAEYVLEFFLPVDMQEGADLQNMVQTLKQHLKSFSGFELGDLSSTTCIGMSMEVNTLSLAMQPYIIQTSFCRELVQIDSQRLWETNSPIDCKNSQDEFDFVDSNNNNPGSASLEKTTNVEKGYDSGEKGLSTKPQRKRKLQSFTLEMLRQYFGMPIGEASRRLGVSRYTLKRVCRELGILTWPIPHRNKKYTHFGVYTTVLLLVKLKRWSCSSNRHGFSARWWICDKHNSSVSKLKLSIQANSSPIFTSALAISPDDDPHLPPPYFSKPLKELGVLDTRNVKVKATFNHDTVKFDFPISFGLMQLKIQVALRLKLRSTRIHLKYRDEDDDLILIACDADFHNLMPFSATSGSNATLKLIIEMAHC